MLELIIKSLTTRVAPMVYIMTFVSLIIGFCFLTGFLVQNGQSILYASGALIPVGIWGGILFLAAAGCLVGYLSQTWHLVTASSIIGFMMWLFASINLYVAGNIYALITFGLFHLLFFGYVYLSSSLGILERQAINKGVDSR